jgi:hypothetical protein
MAGMDMAMMQAHHFQQQHAAMQRQFSVGAPVERLPAGSIPAGSLIINDVFTPTNPTDKYSHGEMVNLTAQRDGFKGNVFTHTSAVDMNRGMASSNAAQGFFKPNATPEETRANLSTVATHDALGLLQDQTKAIDIATASGAKNSALNMSLGGSIASTTEKLYWTAATAWDNKAKPEVRESGLTAAQNMASAYGLSVDKLTSTDPKISGPERARLQSALMNGVNGALEGSPEVGKAKREYATSVGRFESNRNSVVVASGNEGEILEAFRKDASGNSPQNVPKNFNSNYLDTPEATMVGATRWNNGSKGLQEQIAGYSNVNSGVDVFASGSLSLENDQKADVHGTSFAAPRVAATMATLHKQNPTLSSSQIEALMRSSLTHQLDNGNSSVSVLDYQKSSDFMVGRNPQ